MPSRTTCPSCGLDFDVRRQSCPECSWDINYRGPSPIERVREESWGRIIALFATAGIITFAFAAELSEQDVLGPLIGLFVLAWLVALYFAPAFVAWKRRHHQTMAIAALNLFAGWTVVGWIGSLIWSLTAVAE